MKYAESNSPSVSGKWSTFRPVAADGGGRASGLTPGVDNPGWYRAAVAGAWVVIVGLCAFAVWLFRIDSLDIKDIRGSKTAAVAASPSEAAEAKQIVELAVDNGLISNVSPGLGSSSVHVSPSFLAAPIDDKNLILRAVYFHAFNLSPTTTAFPWPLHVVDGVTGRRLLTVDLDSFGLRWR